MYHRSVLRDRHRGFEGCPGVKTCAVHKSAYVLKSRHGPKTGCIGSKTPRKAFEMAMLTRHKGYWISIERRLQSANCTTGKEVWRYRVRIGKNGEPKVLETLWATQEEEGLSLAVAWIGKQVAA